MRTSTTPLHAETIAAQARERQANVLVSVPAHLHAVGALPPGELRPLGRIFSSGAPLDAATGAAVTALAGLPVTEVLGSSETGGFAWRNSGGDGTWTPFPGVTVAANPDDETMVLRSPFAGGGDAGGQTRGADRVRARDGGRFELLGSRSTRRRRAGTSCGRPSSRRRSPSRRCAAPCSAASSRSRCRAGSAWSPRSHARTTARW